MNSAFVFGGVAEILGEDWLDDIAIEMEPENGRPIVWEPMTPRPPPSPATGIESLRQFVVEHRN